MTTSPACRRRVVAVLLGAGIAALLPAQAELGFGRMWSFDDPPLEYLKREYDFAPGPEWLRAVQLATLRLGNGCSASFVSERGLILTNEHCVRAAIAAIATPGDWVRDGFVAAGYADEVRLPELYAEQLLAIEDVTAAMEQGVDAADSPAVQRERRAANERELLRAAAATAPAQRAQVVALYHGARYQLHRYRRFDDVRLVMVPHLQIAQFGGDPDNFVYPRYCLDFAFLRAWVDGAPADTAATAFGWSDGPQEEQPVFLSGSPGSTQRLRTTAELEYLRDARYPRVREMIDARLAILRELAAVDSAHERRLRPTILGYENGQKLYRFEHAALRDPALLQRKAAAEQALAARIAATPALQARFGEVFRQLAEVAAARTQAEARTAFCTVAGWLPLQRAVALATFLAGGDAECLQAARAARAADPELQRAFFADHLQRASRWLPADDPFLQLVLDGREPAAAVARLDASRLGDDVVFAALARGGADAIRASDDVALALAARLLPVLERVRAEADDLEARQKALAAELGQALFRVHGHAVAADATFTPRFSDGRVRGYDSNGTRAPWRTVFHGMLARSAEFDDRPPFDLPAAWRAATDRIDLRTPLDFVCTVDATGGNSGSPVIDVQRRIVGLLFDGNIESLRNEFCFDDRVERSVCVHPLAIVEALTKVYAGGHIVRELQRR